MQPEPPKMGFDVVCCSSTFGYLVSFCNETEPRPFRMHVEIIGGAMHLLRRERSPRELIPDVKGHGHTFPEANTTWGIGLKGSTSHQRLTRYKFGGLNIIQRAEIDACLDTPNKSSSDLATRSRSPSPEQKRQPNVDELTERVARTNISPTTPASSSTDIALYYNPVSETPQSALIDIKTRSIARKTQDTLSEQLPRLWRSQTPNFVLAFHDRGLFADVQVKDVRAEIKKWEAGHARELAQLVALLRNLARVVDARPGKKVEIRATGNTALEVREQLGNAGKAFSAGVRERWEAWLLGARDGVAAGEKKDGALEIAADEGSAADIKEKSRVSLDSGLEKESTACLEKRG